MKKLKAFLCLLLLLLTMTSCTAKFTTDEIKAALPALVESSAVLNKIYFGEGFEIDGSISNVADNGGYFYCDTERIELSPIFSVSQ